MKKGITKREGFTIVELLITALVTVIVVLAVGVTLFDNHRAWQTMYNRVYSDVVIDGHVARRTFDAVVRKSRTQNVMLDEAGNWLEVRYFSDLVSVSPDRYAKLYLADGELKIEYGLWDSAGKDPRIPLNTVTVSSNVASCGFARQAESIQMVLRLESDSQAATVVSSALMHH